VQPFCSIETGSGANILDKLSDRLVSVTVKDQSGFSNDTLEIVLDDGPTPVDYPPVGKELTVTMGYKPVMGAESRYNGVFRELGTFTIDEVKFKKPPAQITITAKAVDTAKTFKKHRSRDHHDKTLKEIFTKIAGEEKLKLKIDEKIGAIKIPHVDQQHQSNMDFAMRIARRYNCTMKPVKGTLYVGPRGADKSVSGKDVKTITVYETDCSSYESLLQKKSKHDGVKARWHDDEEAEEKVETAGDAGEGKVTKTLPYKFASKDEAKKAAEAEKETLDREGETISLEVVGHPDYAAEARMALKGFRPGMRTDWLINSVTHTFTGDEAYTCSIEGEVPGSKDSDKKVAGRDGSAENQGNAGTTSGEDAS
jgi:phage protein D